MNKVTVIDIKKRYQLKIKEDHFYSIYFFMTLLKAKEKAHS